MSSEAEPGGPGGGSAGHPVGGRRPVAETGSPLAQLVASAGLAQEDAVADAENEVDYLCFNIGKERFAVSSAHVLAVGSPLPIVQVPHTPPYVLGVVSWQGRITAVLDLAGYRGLRGVPEPKRFVALRAGDLEAVIPVSAVVGIRSVPVSSVQPAIASRNGVAGRQASGILCAGGAAFAVLDVSDLLSGSSPAPRAEGPSAE